jgi:glycosyltransferase involved in cell wall biosynthesis
LATIVINALNSSSGGGRSIRDSYLRLLNQETLADHYKVLVASADGLEFVDNPNIALDVLPRSYSRTIAAPLVYEVLLDHILRRHGASAVLNLGDLVINSDVPQVYVFDWPYAVDVEARVWKGMTWSEWLSRRTKLVLLERRFRKPAIVVAQTDYIRKRLSQKYGLGTVAIIGNAVTLFSQHDGGRDFGLPSGTKLLCPSVYYPHKNLEILLDAAEIARNAGRDYRFVVTVSPTNAAAARFVDAISARGLQEHVINVGQVEPRYMPSLYRQSDGLILPTLLESFSIVYPEAMSFGLPIFTSDRWFAHSVCGEAARYFDPVDANDVLRTLDEVFGNGQARQRLIEAGQWQLATFPGWTQNFAALQRLIGDLLPLRELEGDCRRELA